MKVRQQNFIRMGEENQPYWFSINQSINQSLHQSILGKYTYLVYVPLMEKKEIWTATQIWMEPASPLLWFFERQDLIQSAEMADVNHQGSSLPTVLSFLIFHPLSRHHLNWISCVGPFHRSVRLQQCSVIQVTGPLTFPTFLLHTVYLLWCPLLSLALTQI